MIRQAHAYLAGAVSGTALIAAAVISFVMLVSLQALKDWPLAGIGGGGDSAAVSSGQPAGGTENAANTGAGGAAGNGANRASRRHGGVNSLVGQRGGTAGRGTLPAPSGGESPSSNSAGGAGSTPSSTSAGGSGGGSGGGSTGSGSGQSTSGAVTGAVNDTVSGVDQATGGALGGTGVTKITEEVVNGAAGPESTVGKTVDKVVETVGGALGGDK